MKRSSLTAALIVVLGLASGSVQADEIHQAARAGDVAAVEALIKEKPASINAAEKGTGLTPLHIAALKGDKELTGLLLTRGVDKDILPSAFRDAIWNGHKEIVEAMIANGAQVKPDMLDSAMNAYKLNVKDPADIHDQAELIARTPENKSARLEIAKLLLAKGADANFRDPQTGEVPLMFAGYWGKDMVELLLANGAGVNVIDLENRASVLHYAAKVTEDKEVFALLIAKGLDVNKPDRYGNTPLVWAARAGNLPGVAALAGLKAEVNAKNQAGWTALHQAACHGHQEIVEALLGSGAQVNARTGYGWTPLYAAVRFSHPDIAAVLLQKGAGADWADLDGRTPLKLAKEKNLTDAVKLLEEHGATETPKNYAGDQGQSDDELRAKRNAFWQSPPRGKGREMKLETRSGQYTIEIGGDEFGAIVGYDLENGGTEEPSKYSTSSNGRFDKEKTLKAGEINMVLFHDPKNEKHMENGLFHLGVHHYYKDYEPGHTNRSRWGSGGLADIESPEHIYGQDRGKSLKDRLKKK